MARHFTTYARNVGAVGPPRLKRAHPSAHGLIAAVAFHYRRFYINVLRDVPPTWGSLHRRRPDDTAVLSTKYGPQQTYLSSLGTLEGPLAIQIARGGSTTPQYGDVTVATVYVAAGGTTVRPIASLLATEASWEHFSIIENNGTTNGFYTKKGDYTSNSTFTYQGGGSTSSGIAYFVVGRNRGFDGTQSVFVDGVKTGSDGTSTNGVYSTTSKWWNVISDATTRYAGTSYIWNRALSDAEIAQLSENPYQLLDTGSRRIFSLPLVEVSSAPPQYARPSADTTTTGWSSTGASLYGVTDEATYDDADYAYSTTLGATCEIDLSAVSDPTVHTGHTIRYRARSQYGGTAWFELSEGVTSIATWTQVLTTGWATYTYTLSSGEAASISNYGNLSVRIKPI